jgi:hypothetical protein
LMLQKGCVRVFVEKEGERKILDWKWGG